MSGHRFFIEDMMQSMESRLVNIASQWQWAEFRRLIAAFGEVENVARFLEKVWRERKRMTEEQLQAYQNAKIRVMTYLLYYDRLQKYHSGNEVGDEPPGSELFAPGGIDDWGVAKKKARKLFSEYMRSANVPDAPAYH